MMDFAVTNSLLHRAYAEKDDADLTPRRVQKLLYLLHGWCLAITGKSLLGSEFVAGPYGPVLTSVEQALAGHGTSPVDDYIKEFDEAQCQVMPYFVDLTAAPQFDAILRQVWSTYRPLSTNQLASLAHEPGAPWSVTSAGEVIPNEIIRLAFVAKARANAVSA